MRVCRISQALVRVDSPDRGHGRVPARCRSLRLCQCTKRYQQRPSCTHAHIPTCPHAHAHMHTPCNACFRAHITITRTYHAMPCYVMSCHVISCHIMSCHTFLFYARWSHASRFGEDTDTSWCFGCVAWRATTLQLSEQQQPFPDKSVTYVFVSHLHLHTFPPKYLHQHLHLHLHPHLFLHPMIFV